MYTPVIDTDVPYADFTPTFQSLEDRVGAALLALDAVGYDGAPTEEDSRLARKMFMEGGATDDELSNPGIVLKLGALLSEYDKQVVASAAQIRTYVTNRLLLESDNSRADIRLKALTLLGKISDVGLFTDKTEVTMRHRPTEELEQLLRERLTKVIEAEVELPSPVPPIELYK